MDKAVCSAVHHGLCITAYGAVNPCCATSFDFKHITEIDNIVDYFYTNKDLESARQTELTDTWLEECNGCKWKAEQGLVSRKDKMLNWFPHADINFTNENKYAIIHMDISFGNSCNQKCIMCNSNFSSQWLKDDILMMDEAPYIRQQQNLQLKNWSLSYDHLDQIASLVSDSFGLGQEFMQNIIIVFLVILPFIALVACSASSRYSTTKILGITLVVLFTGYGTGSYVWVNNFMLPDLKQKLEQDDYVGAWDQLNLLNSFAPFFYNSESIDSDISLPVTLSINEDGVDVYWRPYTESKEYDWRYAGKSPLSQIRLPRGVVHLKLSKEGFHTKELVEANPSFTFANHPIPPSFEISKIEMNKEGTVPDNMIAIDGGRFIPALIGEGITDYKLSPYFIDKFEVTNKQFKQFIDDGGYEIFQYWKDMEFIKDGESLSWEEAKELMVDSTGVNGPLSWELGSYRNGEENLPVTGISWYEAQAYARYKGNILPPMYHWAKAAFPITEIAAPISPVLL